MSSLILNPPFSSLVPRNIFWQQFEVATKYLTIISQLWQPPKSWLKGLLLWQLFFLSLGKVVTNDWFSCVALHSTLLVCYCFLLFTLLLLLRAILHLFYVDLIIRHGIWLLSLSRWHWQTLIQHVKHQLQCLCNLLQQHGQLTATICSQFLTLAYMYTTWPIYVTYCIIFYSVSFIYPVHLLTKIYCSTRCHIQWYCVTKTTKCTPSQLDIWNLDQVMH